MQSNRVLPLLIIFLTMTAQLSHADVIELVGGFESGRFIEGVNLTDNQLSTHLNAQWSANNGVFASLSCFITERGEKNAINRGCDSTLGWFKPINDKHAVTLAVSRHDYSSPLLRGWQYTDISASWHLGKNHKLNVKATDSLLGQNVSSLTTSVFTSKALSDRWRMSFEAGFTTLESSAPVDTLEYAVLGAAYRRGRWSSEFKVMVSSSDYRRFVILDQDKPSLSVNFRYRLY